MAMFDFLTDILGGGARKGYETMGRALGEATGQEQQYLDYLKGQYEPYMGAGREATGEYLPAIQAMGDPQAFYARMMTGYEESPQAQLAREEGIRAATQGASASGMLGSGELMKSLQRYGSQLSAADQQRWLENMEKIYGGYTGGLADISGRGVQALGSFAPVGATVTSDISNLMAQKGMARAGEQMARYQPYQQLIGSAISDGDMGRSLMGLMGLTGV